MKSKIIFLLILLSFILTLSAQAQNDKKKYFLTGKVTDSAGFPVAGAMILIDKKNTNVVTDEKGMYKVKVKADAQKITVFTFGGGAGDTGINGRTTINFVIEGGAMKENTAEVAPGEETVNVGYGKVKSKDLTMPVNQVNASGDKYSSYSTIYEMLKGTVAGVQVIGKNITIQGLGTNNSNNQPLFVVDGIIVSGVDDIQPIQVKSVEVLKGASASIYGSRGANGVLIITLKGHGDNK
jgi:TonB-dependent SusC/RagA subfamily outer membrane receptor